MGFYQLEFDKTNIIGLRQWVEYNSIVFVYFFTLIMVRIGRVSGIIVEIRLYLMVHTYFQVESEKPDLKYINMCRSNRCS